MAKKIALVYDSIYPFIKGGGEKRYYEIAKRLGIQGHEVHLYGMKLWDGPNVIYKEGIYLHGICSSKPLYTSKGKRSIWQAIYFGVNCTKLIKEDFDIIDCCGFPYFSLFACKLVCVLRGKNLISTWHEVWGKDYWKAYLGKLWIFGYLVERLAVKLPNKIIAVSKTTAKRIKSEFGYTGPITIIPNGVDCKALLALKPSSTKSDVIYVGRLVDFKNIDRLIKSVYIIAKLNPTVKCLIIGDGPEKHNLELLTKKLRLEKNVSFLGFLENHDEVLSLIKASKVFVLPSKREGFGIVVIEANACDIPVVTVNYPNNTAKDLIQEGVNGLIVQPTPKSIAKGILKVIKSTGTMHPMKGLKNYSWSIIIKKITETLSIG